MRPVLSLSAAGLAALTLAVTACGGDAGAPSADELADQKPEQALAGMPGVGDVAREYDYEEDEFYVNEVVVDATPDVTAEQLVDILDVMSFYADGEKPVGGTIYRDAGSTEWDPTPAHTALINAPASAEDQLERAERFLLADELEDVVAIVEEDSLAVRTLAEDPIAVAEAAASIGETELAETPEIRVTTAGDAFPGPYDLTLDPPDGERNLEAWLALASAPLRGKTEFDSLRVGPPPRPGEGEAAACLRVAVYNSPTREGLTPDAYGAELGPIVEALAAARRSLGADAEVAASAFVEARGNYIRCVPFIELGPGDAVSDPLGAGWDALAAPNGRQAER